MTAPAGVPSTRLAPTLGDRVWVHRRIEFLVARGVLPSRYELRTHPEVALEGVGVEVPYGRPARAQLLIEEAWRALPRTVSQSRLSEFDRRGDEDWSGPVDPDGLIAGGRIGVSRMLCRRTDPGVTEDQVGASSPPPDLDGWGGVLWLRPSGTALPSDFRVVWWSAPPTGVVWPAAPAPRCCGPAARALCLVACLWHAGCWLWVFVCVNGPETTLETDSLAWCLPSPGCRSASTDKAG